MTMAVSSNSSGNATNAQRTSPIVNGSSGNSVASFDALLTAMLGSSAGSLTQLQVGQGAINTSHSPASKSKSPPVSVSSTTGAVKGKSGTALLHTKLGVAQPAAVTKKTGAHVSRTTEDTTVPSKSASNGDIVSAQTILRSSEASSEVANGATVKQTSIKVKTGTNQSDSALSNGLKASQRSAGTQGRPGASVPLPVQTSLLHPVTNASTNVGSSLAKSATLVHADVQSATLKASTGIVDKTKSTVSNDVSMHGMEFGHKHQDGHASLNTNANVLQAIGNGSVATAPIASTPPQKPELDVRNPQSLEQFGQLLSVKANQGQTQLQVQVIPQGMGQLNVTVSHQADGIHIEVMANQQSTFTWLNQQLPQLQNAMQQAGVNVSQFNLSYNQQDNGAGGQTRDERQHQKKNPNAVSGTEKLSFSAALSSEGIPTAVHRGDISVSV